MWKSIVEWLFGEAEPKPGEAQFDVEGCRVAVLTRVGSHSYFGVFVRDKDDVLVPLQIKVRSHPSDHAKFVKRFEEKMARAEQRFQNREGGLSK